MASVSVCEGKHRVLQEVMNISGFLILWVKKRFHFRQEERETDTVTDRQVDRQIN